MSDEDASSSESDADADADADDEESSAVGSRDDVGRFTSRYDDEDFVEALREGDGPQTTREVATAVGCSRRHAYERLLSLRHDGPVESQTFSNTMVWSVSNAE